MAKQLPEGWADFRQRLLKTSPKGGALYPQSLVDILRLDWISLHTLGYASLQQTIDQFSLGSIAQVFPKANLSEKSNTSPIMPTTHCATRVIGANPSQLPYLPHPPTRYYQQAIITSVNSYKNEPPLSWELPAATFYRRLSLCCVKSPSYSKGNWQ